MQMKLPHREFQWMSAEELENLDVPSFDDNGDYGAVLEVNIMAALFYTISRIKSSLENYVFYSANKLFPIG